jgi:hypothetical protein
MLDFYFEATVSGYRCFYLLQYSFACYIKNLPINWLLVGGSGANYKKRNRKREGKKMGKRRRKKGEKEEKE